MRGHKGLMHIYKGLIYVHKGPIRVEYEWKPPRCTNGGNSSLHGKGLASSSISISLIAERIDKFERQLIEWKLLLVDYNRKPLSKVVSTVNEDSDSEVEEVFDEHTTFMASIGLKRGSDSSYGTNSMSKKWNEMK
ncbi:hypothetical protein Tco_0848367 [Tanacetum coccineum]